jgi:hypothetical protein
VTARCAECGREFPAQRSTARYCGAACRQRASRRRRATSTSRRSLVNMVRREVERFGAIDTVDGQLALLLEARTASAAVPRLVETLRELREAVARLQMEPR